MPTGTIHPKYGNASATPPAWSDVDTRLATAQLYWLATVRRDGRPHVVPLCGVWLDGSFFFATGDDEQKMRNLATNSQVSVTAGPLGADGWSSGKDICVEGRAERVTDDAELATLAAAWFDKYGDDWRWDARDGRFFERGSSADSRGAQVFCVTPSKVMVFGDDHGQTAYR